MSKIKFSSFKISRFRSLLDVDIPISDEFPVVICGENNIGKTNFLRALNLFFNHIHFDGMFKPNEDIPYHVYFGSRGAGSKTELTGKFEEGDKKIVVKAIFKPDGNIEYKINNITSERKNVEIVLGKFKFVYIESNNINLPSLMSEVLEKDGLLSLDSKRRKQSEPLEKLNEFIQLSQNAISDIEREINKCFDALTDFDGILKGKKVKINFAEFDRLRDVVKTMTSITLHDGNNNSIASKGSGAQRAVFISLMQYISQNTKNNVIWGIDEPEVFLQPRLQKKLSSVISEIVAKKRQPSILTTHSQHFVNLNNLKSTHLFVGEVTPKEYSRKPGQVFYETNTYPLKAKSNYEKAVYIKNHLGISSNDGWEVLPYNLIVEGEEDKKYIEALFALIGEPAPSIIWSGGASKIGGYLQYYNMFSKELGYKPKFVCIFDNDDEGRDQAKRVRPKSYKHIVVEKLDLPRYDGVLSSELRGVDWEIEDFLPPVVLMRAVNLILRSEGYRKLTKVQLENRTKPANMNAQILSYFGECCKSNNPEKTPIPLDNEGRKKQICKKVTDILARENDGVINQHQMAFLKEMIKPSN